MNFLQRPFILIVGFVAVAVGCSHTQPNEIPLESAATPGPLPEFPRHEIQRRLIPGGVLLVSMADRRLPLTSFRLAFRRHDCRHGGLSNDRLAKLIRRAVSGSALPPDEQLIVRSNAEGLSLGKTTLRDTSLKAIGNVIETMKAMEYRGVLEDGVEKLRTLEPGYEIGKPGEIARHLFLTAEASPQPNLHVNPTGREVSDQPVALVLVGDYPAIDAVGQSIEAAELGRLLPPGCPDEYSTSVTQRLFVDRPDLSRIHFAIGTKLASRRESGYLAAMVFSIAIKERLTYRLPRTALSSAIIPGRRASRWLLRADSPIDEASEVIAQVQEEMHMMEHVGLTDSEFQRFYRRVLQTVPGQFETRDQWARALSSLFISGLDVSRPFALLDRLRTMDLSRLNTQLKHQLEGHRLRAIGVGPWSALKIDKTAVEEPNWSFVDALGNSNRE